MVRSVTPHIVALAIALIAVPAAAQSDDDKERANELAAEAVAAFKADDFATAAERFAEAHSYYPQSSLKLNEMVAWYKADDCESAMSVARWIGENVDGLTSADEKDLDRVSSDCSYREANALFEAGDLDGASAILAGIETEDGEVALKVGRLQGKLEERRNAQVDTPPEETVVEEPSEPVEPPPSWWKPAGFAGLGVGGALIIGGVVQTILDQRTLQTWREACYPTDGSPADRDCVRDESGEVVDFPESVSQQTKTANTVTGILIGVGSASVVAGGVLLTLHYLRQGKYEKSLDDDSTEMTLLPTVSPDGAGLVLQVQF